MLISFLASTLLLGGRLALGQEDCTVFKEGACPLEESNIIGNSGDATNAAECQAMCKFEPTGSCNFFTYLGSQCYLLASCDFVEECPDCICGPNSPSFSECPWPPMPETTIGTTGTAMETTTAGTAGTTTIGTEGTTTEMPWTTTTTMETTTKTTMAPTTTTTMPATSPTRPPCDVNEGQICEGEHNLISHIEHINSASDCQAICQNHPECGFWSHYRQGEGHDHWGHCYIYTQCDHLTDHECFGPDDHECRDMPHPRPPGHKCSCQSGGPTPDLDECGDYPPTPLPCIGDFWPGLRCDEHENQIEHITHIPSRSDCQAICQNHDGCEFFSHAMDHEGNNGECWLHYNCDRLVDHECEDCLVRPGGKCGCFCGPKFPDLDDCSEGPTTASP